MDNLRCLAKKSPAPIVLHTLKTALVMPPSVASSLIDEVTKPTSAQKTWIKRIGNSFWKGALIAEEICNNSDADAIRRLRRANVVIFEIHGMTSFSHVRLMLSCSSKCMGQVEVLGRATVPCT